MTEVTSETLKEIVKRIDENVHEIKEQTTKTNGRVNCLEKWRDETNGILKFAKVLVIPIILAIIISYIT